MKTLVVGAMVAASGACAWADDVIVDFEGANEGNWSYFGDPNNPVEVIEDSGGNPGAYLHSTCSGLNCLDTFAPQLRTQAGTTSAFTGDYRGGNVSSLGVDLILHDVDFNAGGRPLTLILSNDAGTPDNQIDDSVVYLVGVETVPEVGEGWKSFGFEVDSQSGTLPKGWTVPEWSVLKGDEAWNAVIEDVSQVTFFYGDPSFFFIFQQWEPGADNIRITTAGGCPADINGDGVLNILDFIAFQNTFAAGEDIADCNGDGSLNVLDFVCYQGVFQKGCP